MEESKDPVSYKLTVGKSGDQSLYPQCTSIGKSQRSVIIPWGFGLPKISFAQPHCRGGVGVRWRCICLFLSQQSKSLLGCCHDSGHKVKRISNPMVSCISLFQSRLPKNELIGWKRCWWSCFFRKISELSRVYKYVKCFVLFSKNSVVHASLDRLSSSWPLQQVRMSFRRHIMSETSSNCTSVLSFHFILLTFTVLFSMCFIVFLVLTVVWNSEIFTDRLLLWMTKWWMKNNKAKLIMRDRICRKM